MKLQDLEVGQKFHLILEQDEELIFDSGAVYKVLEKENFDDDLDDGIWITDMEETRSTWLPGEREVKPIT